MGNPSVPAYYQNNKVTYEDYYAIINNVNATIDPLRPKKWLIGINYILAFGSSLGILWYITNKMTGEESYFNVMLAMIFIFYIFFIMCNIMHVANCLKRMESSMKETCRELDVLYKPKGLKFKFVKAHESTVTTTIYENNSKITGQSKYDAVYFIIYA
ncbi:hypothetical protein HDV01_002315 [Terramyces sp. JEL0728]|nr:hypothetical protein HDV01_002315 [Terramyces sp. JEL0728]